MKRRLKAVIGAGFIMSMLFAGCATKSITIEQFEKRWAEAEEAMINDPRLIEVREELQSSLEEPSEMDSKTMERLECIIEIADPRAEKICFVFDPVDVDACEKQVHNANQTVGDVIKACLKMKKIAHPLDSRQ